MIQMVSDELKKWAKRKVKVGIEEGISRVNNVRGPRVKIPECWILQTWLSQLLMKGNEFEIGEASNPLLNRQNMSLSLP